jgi:hypothetical protein
MPEMLLSSCGKGRSRALLKQISVRRVINEETSCFYVSHNRDNTLQGEAYFSDPVLKTAQDLPEYTKTSFCTGKNV